MKRRFALGLLVGSGLTAAWLGLTLHSGLTYHLFPAVIAGAPAFIAGLVDGERYRWRPGLLVGLPR